jgi:endo-1,4-beta-xylanase
MAKRKQKKNALKWWLVPLATLLAGLAVFFHAHPSVKTPALPEPPLKQLAASHDIELGLLTKPSRLTDKTYRQILTSQFSSITSDGQIHWDKLEPSPHEYHFGDMDTLVVFAQAHHMPVQAHHLLWTEADSLPKWLKNGHYTKEQLYALMQERIKTVVGRYKGRVNEWTVVNEPFTRARHIYGLDDWFGDQLGSSTGYIEQAFRWAHQADPKAKLLLNDFYNETKTAVSDDMYGYLKAAKARGVPIDGIGIQMHIDASRPPGKAAMVKNMQRFAAIGVPVYITEFDIDSTAVKATNSVKAIIEAHITRDVVRACIESKNCASFTAFGMTDGQSLLKKLLGARARSRLFTGRYEPKASFYAFRNAWLEP